MPKVKQLTAKLIIVDGNALIHRAFHALPPMQTKDGTLVNAVYGFTTILFRVLRELQPTHIAVAFDLAGPTFRHELSKEYKAQRVKQPDELYAQIPLTKELLKAFRIPVFEKQGYEADDVIGSIAKQVGEANEKLKMKNEKLSNADNQSQLTHDGHGSPVTGHTQTIIVTGDYDTLQLVNENTTVYALRQSFSDTILYDAQGVQGRFHLKPEQLVDYKALRGDPSDNIPGVKGIGEKTASALIGEFETLEKLYQAVDKAAKAKDWKPKAGSALTARWLKLLQEHRDDAFQSQTLSRIVTDLDVGFDLDTCRFGQFDRQEVINVLQKLEFHSLLAKIPTPEATGKSPQPPLAKGGADVQTLRATSPHYELISTEQQLSELIDRLSKTDAIAVDTETTSLNPWQAKLVGISLCAEPGEAYFVDARLLTSKDVARNVSTLLANPAIAKVGHNLKYDYEVLATAGIALDALTGDTMLMAYLLNPGRRGLNLIELAFSELGLEKQPIETLIGKAGPKQLTMDQVDLETVAQYASQDADLTLRLYQQLLPQLDERNAKGLLEKMEMPLIPVLAEMERLGVKIDVPFLEHLAEEFDAKLKTIGKEIHRLAGEEFNISSPQQLKAILFDKLKLQPEKGLRKTKTGVSTAADVLEKLQGEHPIIDQILQYREYSKLQSTYVLALPQLVDQANGRVHTTYNQAVTATGRLSSSDPNLQNIPIRTEIGRQLRQAFIAEDGYQLLSIDYSQIELRIVASLANDGKMLEGFRRGEDIHARTAAEIHGVPLESVTFAQRRSAKEVNFGVLYGMGPYGLAERTGISREEARAFIDKYFATFQGIAKYLEETKGLARQNGYVETLLGRRRYLPEINSGVFNVRQAAERMAVNMPIQGTAADLMKLAMIQCAEAIKPYGNDVRMLLQVHDELVFEVRDGLMDEVVELLRPIMENVYKMRAPVATEAKVGENWGEMEKAL